MNETVTSLLPSSIQDHLSALAGAGTLTEVLQRRAAAQPDSAHLHLLNESGEAEQLTYRYLHAEASQVAAGLRAAGLRPGDAVAMMLSTGRDFFASFFGTLLAGGIPVPLYPPFRADRIEEYAGRQTAILQNAEARVLITFRQAERLAKLLKPRVASLKRVTTVPRLLHDSGSAPPDAHQAQPEDVAVLQYTSGSTGEPRGVALTHRNLVTNLGAIGYGVQARPDDVVVCWLPLYHDMGLIGCWLFSLYFGLPLVALSPLDFLRRPERWLWAFHHYRGTLSPAPNFAYELCVRKISDRALEGLDLSSWRVALNGAEPISPDTLDRFSRRFGPFGFRPEAMMPVYGLAECSVALSFAPLSEPPRIDRVGREAFARERRAVVAASDNADPLQFVSVGRALPGHEIRIVDDDRRPLPERVEGHLEFRGPSAMKGYHRNPEATAEAIKPDGWYRTGDLAYFGEGDVFITGRTKDLIIKGGRNIYPQEIEEAAADVDGIRRGCVAAFAIPDHATGTERLVVVAETRETDHAARGRLVSEVKRRVSAHCRVSPDVVYLVPPQTVPKTPSGKLRRGACRELFLSNTLTLERAPVWLQVARLMAGNARAWLRRS